MSASKRKIYTGVQKAKIALEAVRGIKTINEIAQDNNVQSLLLGLTDYFMFYNEERRHQSLGYETPNVVYQTARGGGAMIVDKYGAAEISVSVSKKLGQRHSAGV